MQRSFSSFPASWPGAGLLLLRVTVGATALVQGITNLTASGNASLGIKVVGLLAVATGLSLLIGFFTSVAGLLATVGSACIAFSWFPMPIPHLVNSLLATIFVIVMAIAIVVLGPGAFSLDAYLFGRREIVIPPASRAPQS